MPHVHHLYYVALAADNAWMAAIARFCKGRPGDVRYTPAAHGEPGSELRAAYDDFCTAQAMWRAAFK